MYIWVTSEDNNNVFDLKRITLEIIFRFIDQWFSNRPVELVSPGAVSCCCCEPLWALCSTTLLKRESNSRAAESKGKRLVTLLFSSVKWRRAGEWSTPPRSGVLRSRGQHQSTQYVEHNRRCVRHGNEEKLQHERKVFSSFPKFPPVLLLIGGLQIESSGGE